MPLLRWAEARTTAPTRTPLRSRAPVRSTSAALVVLVSAGGPALLAAQSPPPPIIDMHLHASAASANGPPPVGICVPGMVQPAWDPARPYAEVFLEHLKNPPCESPVWGPETDGEVMSAALEILERRNIYGVTSGAPHLLEQWEAAGGSRIIPGLWFGRALRSYPSPDDFRTMLESGRYRVFGEVAIQYDGMSPSDPEFEPYLAIAEELDLPMGIHIGTGPPGAPYLYPVFSEYRARLHSALILEEALIRHPRLRVYVMHAGWPNIDDLLALLWAHPQVYVGVGVISYALPRAEFHAYLRRIVEAGFASRVMFGSDEMSWPAAIEHGIASIEDAPFLSARQKRDILFNNAARFLRLDEREIARMHSGR